MQRFFLLSDDRRVRMNEGFGTQFNTARLNWGDLFAYAKGKNFVSF
jgi:uncharacterized protein with PIN domain